MSVHKKRAGKCYRQTQNAEGGGEDSQCTDAPSTLRAKAHYRALIYTVI